MDIRKSKYYNPLYSSYRSFTLLGKAIEEGICELLPGTVVKLNGKRIAAFTKVNGWYTKNELPQEVTVDCLHSSNKAFHIREHSWKIPYDCIQSIISVPGQEKVTIVRDNKPEEVEYEVISPAVKAYEEMTDIEAAEADIKLFEAGGIEETFIQPVKQHSAIYNKILEHPDIPPDIKAKALACIENEVECIPRKAKDVNIYNDYLSQAFTWDTTSLGHIFWSDLDNDYELL